MGCRDFGYRTSDGYEFLTIGSGWCLARPEGTNQVTNILRGNVIQVRKEHLDDLWPEKSGVIFENASRVFQMKDSVLIALEKLVGTYNFDTIPEGDIREALDRFKPLTPEHSVAFNRMYFAILDGYLTAILTETQAPSASGAQ
ncbi:MAG TPA: hypothetical protein VI612_00505 [Candidatus Nanoarchaeia archaeon]|nr:hypothetical protein [Candidatus Nanoarchaeia archaeon]